MKFFKNFQTKRQLKAENERLRLELNIAQQRLIPNTECEMQKVSACVKLRDSMLEIPIEDIKKEILYRIADEMEPYIT